MELVEEEMLNRVHRKVVELGLSLSPRSQEHEHSYPLASARPNSVTHDRYENENRDSEKDNEEYGHREVLSRDSDRRAGPTSARLRRLS